MSASTHDERQDFFREVARAGYKVADFKLEEVEHDVQQGLQLMKSGTVTVTRRTGSVSRSYKAGHGHAWVVAFLDELKAGVFGSP